LTNNKKGKRLKTTTPATFKYLETLNNRGDVGLALAVKITIPPAENPVRDQAFCLAGSNPIRIYKDVDLKTPAPEALETTPEINRSSTGEPTCLSEMVIHLVVPARSRRYLSIELAFAGVGQRGFPNSANKLYSQSYLLATQVTTLQTPGGAQLPTPLPDNVGIQIVGNKLRGVGGFALDELGNPRVGYEVRVRSKQQDVATSQTDENGYFLLRLPPGGPYKLQLRDPNTHQNIAFAQVNELSKDQFAPIRWSKKE
jgi:hypothetical protein